MRLFIYDLMSFLFGRIFSRLKDTYLKPVITLLIFLEILLI